jgi:N-acyl-D-amino-acid deacylase
LYDLVIKNGRVVNGSGSPWFYADVGVKGGKISSVGKIKSNAHSVIDACKVVISPGFVDVHSHSDVTLLVNPKAESYVRQGITTAINGNCGGSPVPLVGLIKEEYKSRKSYVSSGVEIDWSTHTEYCDTLEKKGIAINAATLIGHGNLRAGVMGKEGYSPRVPSDDEFEKMKSLLEQSLFEGAFGLSTGLVYPPGVYAKTDELIELCKVLPRFGALFAIHIRGQGDQFLDAVREAIEIGEKSGAVVLLSHHSPNPGMWGNTKVSLRWIDEARDRGVDVSIDKHGYIYGSTGLGTVLPPYAHEGEIKDMIQRLKEPDNRERMKKDIEGALDWPRVSPALHARAGAWENITITSANVKQYEGITIEDIAKSKGVEPVEAVFDVLIENEGVIGVKYPAYSEGDLMRVFQHHTSMIATDGSAIAPYGSLGRGSPHPKSYGTFPNIFRKYVRDLSVLTLEEAVKKMTSQAAHRFGIWDRGLILPGMWADIVIFDPRTIVDKATFDNPAQYPVGINYVLVNGEVVVDNGEHTGALPGKALKHGL